MSRETYVDITPGDSSKESIRNLKTVVEIKSNKGVGHIIIETHCMSGSIEEKLSKYKKLFGRDWSGSQDFVRTIPIKKESVGSLELGKVEHEVVSGKNNPITIEAQKKIDALVVEAQKILKEHREYKKSLKNTRHNIVESIAEHAQ